MIIDGIEVINGENYDIDEVREWIRQAKEKAGCAVAKMFLMANGDKVRIGYETIERKFERIRRITGYLVGTVDRWNNAKRAEERERVKHIG